jgi:hypothetical protein
MKNRKFFVNVYLCVVKVSCWRYICHKFWFFDRGLLLLFLSRFMREANDD